MSSVPWTWPGSLLVRAVDGDSIVAQLTRDIGFHGTLTYLQRLRLNRINTPPASTDAGKAATMFTERWVGPTALLIETVKAYKYGDEWMAEVTAPDGTNLSDALVAAGLAVYWDGTGPRPGG